MQRLILVDHTVYTCTVHVHIHIHACGHVDCMGKGAVSAMCVVIDCVYMLPCSKETIQQ